MTIAWRSSFCKADKLKLLKRTWGRPSDWVSKQTPLKWPLLSSQETVDSPNKPCKAEVLRELNVISKGPPTMMISEEVSKTNMHRK